MPTFVITNRLQPKDGQRDKLIGLLREFAVSMHAEPGCVHYSVHVPVDDEAGPLTVIQAYSSREAFGKHSAWMGPNLPRLAALLASPPQPPVLYQQVSLSGHSKESLSALTSPVDVPVAVRAREQLRSNKILVAYSLAMRRG